MRPAAPHARASLGGFRARGPVARCLRLLDRCIQQLARGIPIAGQFTLGELHRDECVDQALLRAVVQVADDAATRVFSRCGESSARVR
jgi:hypothetical protein